MIDAIRFTAALTRTPRPISIILRLAKLLGLYGVIAVGGSLLLTILRIAWPFITLHMLALIFILVALFWGPLFIYPRLIEAAEEAFLPSQRFVMRAMFAALQATLVAAGWISAHEYATDLESMRTIHVERASEETGSKVKPYADEAAALLSRPPFGQDTEGDVAQSNTTKSGHLGQVVKKSGAAMSDAAYNSALHRTAGLAPIRR